MKSKEKNKEQSKEKTQVETKRNTLGKLSILLLSTLLSGFGAYAAPPTVHGMFLFGGGERGESTYASHLPMFHAPHDRQVLLQIGLKNLPGEDVLTEYAAKKKSGENFFTLEPELFDLEKLVQGKIKTFDSSLYLGHFERGGQSLGRVQVSVQRILYSSQLNPAIPLPIEESYFVFGKMGSTFALHVIHGRPSFDAILEVGQPYRLSSPFCKARYCPEPRKKDLAENELPLTLAGPRKDGLTQPLGAYSKTQADVKKVLYFEEGDLSHL